MSPATNSGSPTPPIEISGGAAAATARLAAPVVLLDDEFLARLGEACADVRLDPGERAEASRDWWPLAMVWATEGKVGQVAGAVARPGSTEELAAALKAIAPAGLPIVPRGGGMSYTDGYLPRQPDSIMVDLLRLNRVLEVNPEDCYVTVEAGATWKELCDALEPHGVRTPYFGPLSGLRATIGGALQLAGQRLDAAGAFHHGRLGEPGRQRRGQL